jgi:hypothetical protein
VALPTSDSGGAAQRNACTPVNRAAHVCHWADFSEAHSWVTALPLDLLCLILCTSDE